MFLLEFIGSNLLGGVIAFANAAGIGGGGFIVPICLIFFGFSTTESVTLANSCGFAGSVTRFIFNFRQRHPLVKHRVLINYEICLIMLPMILLGSLFGVQINLMIPDIAVLVLLICLLIVMAILTIYNGVKKCREENKMRALKKVHVQN